jgi:hypothetical protein
MRTRLALGAVLFLAGPLSAQGATALYSRWNTLTGFEFQRYGFTQGVGIESASQWSVPLVVVAPLGRQMSLDLTTHYAHSQVVDSGGSAITFSGLTDTQLRLLYTVGRDRAVASLSLNLPTGERSFTSDKFGVSSAMGSNFLSFPVGSLGTSFGVTGGIAYAVPAGGWNVGLAGSVRYQGNYEPVRDSAFTLSYNPGLEGRLRLGADRVIGQRSRLLLGLTYSSFSTDQFSGGGVVAGWFNPGARLIGEMGYAYSWGRTTLALGGWDFYRLAGKANGVSNPGTKENVFNAELRLGRQFSPRLVIEPLVGVRQWSPSGARGGRLYTLGMNGRFGLSDQVSGVLNARFGPGWVYDAAGQRRADVTATGVSLFLRYQR